MPGASALASMGGESCWQLYIHTAGLRKPGIARRRLAI